MRDEPPPTGLPVTPNDPTGNPGAIGARFAWGSWVPLRGAGRNRSIPAVPGLYRVRVTDGPVVYLGQTGGSLRARVGMLAGVDGDVMPYNDPHTAGPGLWALRHRDGGTFEVSVVPLDATRWERCGLEALALTLTGSPPACRHC